MNKNRTRVMPKRVRFDTSLNVIEHTWSSDEYNRCQIDSVLYNKCYGRVSEQEWSDIFRALLIYKITEMIVHKDTIV
jgi:hypothetical protein